MLTYMTDYMSYWTLGSIKIKGERADGFKSNGRQQASLDLVHPLRQRLHSLGYPVHTKQAR